MQLSGGAAAQEKIVSVFVLFNSQYRFGHFFIADTDYQIKSIRWVTSAASGSGTLQFKKLTGTQDHTTQGNNLLQSAASLPFTANMVNTGTLTGTAADLLLTTGDRIGWAFSDEVDPESGMYIITIGLMEI